MIYLLKHKVDQSVTYPFIHIVAEKRLSLTLNKTV